MYIRPSQINLYLLFLSVVKSIERMLIYNRLYITQR